MELVKDAHTESDHHRSCYIAKEIVESLADMGLCDKEEMTDQMYHLMRVIYRTKWAA